MSKLRLFAVHIFFKGDGVLVLETNSKGAQDSVLKEYGLTHVWSVREIQGPFEDRSILFEFNESGTKLKQGSAI